MVEYRKAILEDAEGAAKILLKNYNIKNITEAKAIFEEELERYNYIVAVDEKKIVGLSCWRMHGLPKHMLAESSRIAINSEYQGKGIATELFGKIVRDAVRFYKTHNSKLRKLYAYVHASNKKAQKFYDGLGLIKEATLKDHFYSGEDEFIYSLFLD